MTRILVSWFLAFLALGIWGCSSTSTESGDLLFTEEDLPLLQKLSGRKYHFPEILNPRGMALSGNKAVVFERKNTSDVKFHIIDLKDEAYLGSK